MAPIPWMLILGILGGSLAFAIAVALEIRRRRRKKAMERYAIKRMRRKFRAVDKTFSAIETLYGAGYSFNEG